jgi:hypothetical protein
MDYDTWKLMTPEEASSTVYADVEVELGVWITLDEYKEIVTTLQVPVEEDWDDDSGTILVPINIEENVLSYMSQEYPDCEYDLLNWKFI